MIIIIGGCKIINSRSPEKLTRTVLICDNSGSLVEEKFQAVLEKIRELLIDWVDSASPKDIFEIKAFNYQNRPYQVESLERFEMPYLSIPANKAREKLKKEYSQKLAKAFSKMPTNVGYTPLLEALVWASQFYGNSQDEVWEIVIVSDLIQCSKNLSFTTSYLTNRTNEEILEDMLNLVPVPKNLPKKVSLFTYPGLVNKDKATDLPSYQRLQALFKQFFKKWRVQDILIKNLEVR